jgi:hypothetical protein
MNTGLIVNLQFGIKLHKRDQYLLESIKTFFMDIGSISSLTFLFTLLKKSK